MPRSISNSEVSAWLKCPRYYFYAFDLGLAPLRPGNALARGIVGHSALEAYYKALMNGENHESSVKYANRVLMRALERANTFDLDMVGELKHVLGRYFAYAENDGWKILAVERRFDMPIVDDFQYTLRLDVAIRDPKYNNEVVLVDHKFVYNFWSQDDLDLNPQLPKYMGAIQQNGLQVDRIMVNQIRYRIRKSSPYSDDEMFRRSYSKPTRPQIQNLMREQILISRDIIQHKTLPIEERNRRMYGVRNKMICKNCSMASLCLTDIGGGDINLLVQTEYKKSEYGYNDVPAFDGDFQFGGADVSKESE